MALQLKLQKEGETAPKLKLNLTKGALFTVELYWDDGKDLDVHALCAVNDGAGAKVSAMEQVLSTYNTKKNNPAAGVLANNADGSFSLPDGSLTHSGDSRSGVQKDVDEVVTIDGSKIPAGVNEIPIFVTIHPAEPANTFALVKKAGIRIKSDGKVLGEYELSSEFAKFNAIQMGSLVLGAGGWEYAAVGNGFTGDLNVILGHFS